MDGITTEYNSSTDTWTITWVSGPITVTAALSVNEALEMARSIIDTGDDTEQ